MFASIHQRPRVIALAALLMVVLAAPTLLAVEPAKSADPPPQAVGHPANATGGPDGFGYTFFDQNDGCTFSFVDISATGTFIVDGDDTSSGPVALSAPFDIYGTAFNSLVMASNGYISTDGTDTGPDLSPDCPIPATPSTGGGARLYPLHDDLDLEDGIGEGFTEYFPVCPRPSDRCATNEDCTIFMWDDVGHFPGGVDTPTWDMEVILYHQTNDIVYQIGPGNPETGGGSTTGMQDFPPPTTALLYACDTAGSVPDNTAVCISHPNPVPEACEPFNVLEVPTTSRTGLVLLLLAIAGAALLILKRQF